MLLDSSKLEFGQLAIFCGAGISWNSGLPLANELVSYLLEKFFKDKKSKYIEEIKNSNLPFEAFIETLSESITVSEILDIFKDGKPNTNHIWIAKLSKSGYIKTILTTNFDLLIEKALEQEGLRRNKDFDVYFTEEEFSKIDFNSIDDNIKVFKIHGSIEDKDSIRTTLKTVANKSLSDKRMALIRYLFSEGKHKDVFVLGYSCSDEFDITPQIQSIEGCKKEITFIEHDNSSIEVSEELRIKEDKNPFKNFSGMRIKCNTDKLIEKYWNLMDRALKEEYSFIYSESIWKKHIDMWSENLEDENTSSKYLCIGVLFNRISNFKMAIKYYRKPLNNSVIDEKMKAICYACIGDSYDGLGNIN
jgi:NAD-dependent SIR2 family protein deacetylase